MSDRHNIDLYELLPVFYRLQDAERGFPLRAMLEVISSQADILKLNIDGLWDDFFIETCGEWVIPYIGDLVANNPLHEVAARRRADVAKTISYRRRKATLPMLEELARDVTGWHAHAVAFFEMLGWTQHLNHLRFEEAPEFDVRDPKVFDRVGTVNLRNSDALDRLNGAFDIICHTADVRPISRGEGWYNIRNIGFFLYRLRHYPLTAIRPSQASAPHGFHFSTLGNPAPLFNNPEREADPTGLASEIHVPDAIRPVAFHFRPQDYYGADRSFAIYRGPVVSESRLVPQSEIMCKDLSEWAAPPAGKVAVDVRLGRFAFAPGEVPTDGVTAFYNYGFSADMGGGPYDRKRRRSPSEQTESVGPDTVANPDALGELIRVPSQGIDTIADAIEALAELDPITHPKVVIQIEDNRTYREDLVLNFAGTELVIQAKNGNRPTVIGQVVVTGSSQEARLAFDGLLIAGGVRLQSDLRELSIRHCTLVPGLRLGEDGSPLGTESPSLVVTAGNGRLKVEIDRSVTGALRLPAEIVSLGVRDSIIHSTSTADQPAINGVALDDSSGPPTVLERTTVFGRVLVKELTLASEVIFTHRVEAERRQRGCVRFSFAPAGSTTPRRYRCQPDLEIEARVEEAEKKARARNPSIPETELNDIKARVRAEVISSLVPSFTSTRYGQSAYAQLHPACPRQIQTGAEDGSEMGAFAHLKQPQRESNLRIRLDEYLPFGLEPGIIYVT